MIVEWVFSLVATIINFILGLMPPLPDTGSISGQVASAVGTLSGYASSLGSWVPWSTIESCIGLILATLAVSFVIKVVRITASFFTAGGGSAA